MNILMFLRDNWKVIVEIVVLLTTIILWIIRKKPVKVVDTLKEVVLAVLPYCINNAESAAKGEKLSVCLTLLREALQELGYELTPELAEFASKQVEIILSTPQKKGVKTYEKQKQSPST